MEHNRIGVSEQENLQLILILGALLSFTCRLRTNYNPNTQVCLSRVMNFISGCIAVYL